MLSQTLDGRSRKLRWLALTATLFAAVAVTTIALLAHEFSEASREYHRQAVLRGQEDLDRQLGELKSGKGNSVHLYETRETDALLRQIQQRAEVEELTLEMTDVTDDGIASVVTLPRLRRLVIYGGSPGITDRGLAGLKGKTSLEALELRNTRVTDDGLRVLLDLPNLRSLTLYYDPWRGARLTDAGLSHLRNLPKLETVKLTGGWASGEAVAELRAALPTCKVHWDPRVHQPTSP
jgi:hypothetical protein